MSVPVPNPLTRTFTGFRRMPWTVLVGDAGRRVHVSPMDLRYMVDLLTRDAQEFFHLVNVVHDYIETSRPKSGRLRPMALGPALREIGVPVVWNEGDDAIISAKDLGRVVDGLDPRTIAAFDSDRVTPISEEQRRVVDTALTGEDDAVLQHLPDSKLLFVSHDRTWLDVEASTSGIAERIPARFFWMVVGTALERSDPHTEVHLPPVQFVQELFSEIETFCTRSKWIAVDSNCVVVPYSTTRFGGLSGQKWVKKSPRQSVIYDLDSGSWTISDLA